MTNYPFLRCILKWQRDRYMTLPGKRNKPYFNMEIRYVCLLSACRCPFSWYVSEPLDKLPFCQTRKEFDDVFDVYEEKIMKQQVRHYTVSLCN